MKLEINDDCDVIGNVFIWFTSIEDMDTHVMDIWTLQYKFIVNVW